MSDARFVIVETGVVAELDGGFFGIQYEDGRSTSYGFGPIEKATIREPRFCRKPTDMTWRDSHMVEPLSRATLKTITKTTTYEVTP